MEFLTVIHILWRRRTLVAIGAVVALALASIASGAVRLHPGHAGVPAGQALAKVMIDTPESLAASTAEPGDDTIDRRMNLLAQDLSTPAAAGQVAREAGLARGDVAIVGPFIASAAVPGVLHKPLLPERTAVAARAAVRQRHVVDVRTDQSVPIMSIGTLAPSVAGARRLADAVVAVLKARAAGSRRGRAGVVVEPLGTARASVVPATGPVRRRLGVGVAVVLFALWCAGIVVASWLRRWWRRVVRPARPAE
jgi:hypothetical protein